MSLNSTPRTWVTGEVVTAAEMNTEIQTAFTGIQAAWTPYTPVVANFTPSSSTMTARYLQIGKTLQYRFDLVGAGTCSASGAMSVPLPAGMTSFNGGLQNLHTRHYNGALVLGESFINPNSTSIQLYTTSAISTFNSGYEVTVAGTLELA